MRIAALQFHVRRGRIQDNLERVLQGLEQAAEQEVELVLLPEMWSTSFLPAAELESLVPACQQAQERLTERSQDLGLAVAGSSLGAHPSGLPHNTMRLVDAGQELLAYHKVQLFSPTAEHQAFTPGELAPPTVSWRGWKLAAGVCYDLRFPQLWRAAFVAEAELILVSAQWPIMRIAHWEALLRGRAVEHQAFFLGCNRTGQEPLGKRGRQLDFPGRSLLATPHGEVLAQGGDEEGLIVGEIQRDLVNEQRRILPVRRDERLV